ncbi:MAG: hypothetical protein Ct9H90mP27_6330 [Gammaproteobacteria bacterium]|nr:MAG: hypothetical protein Ct9H90mP27_6330 [Gammaproteobacteria bacterium]
MGLSTKRPAKQASQKRSSELMAAAKKTTSWNFQQVLRRRRQKFILRPIASGTEDMLEQTNRLITEVLPEMPPSDKDIRRPSTFLLFRELGLLSSYITSFQGGLIVNH